MERTAAEYVNVKGINQADILGKMKRAVDCELTGIEREQRGYQLARELSNLEAHKETEAEKVANAKIAQKAIEAKISSLKKVIEANREDRLIDCVTFFENGEVKVARYDNGEVIEARNATIHETQVHMPGFAEAGQGGVVAEAGRRVQRSNAANDGAPDHDVDVGFEILPPIDAPIETPRVMLELSDGSQYAVEAIDNRDDYSADAESESAGDSDDEADYDVLSDTAKAKRRKSKPTPKKKGKR